MGRTYWKFKSFKISALFFYRKWPILGELERTFYFEQCRVGAHHCGVHLSHLIRVRAAHEPDSSGKERESENWILSDSWYLINDLSYAPLVWTKKVKRESCCLKAHSPDHGNAHVTEALPGHSLAIHCRWNYGCELKVITPPNRLTVRIRISRRKPWLWYDDNICFPKFFEWGYQNFIT